MKIKRDEQYTSQFGGTVTPQELEWYVNAKAEDVQRDIRMYMEHHVHKKSLRRVAEEFGVSHMTVHYRIKAMLGYINKKI